MKASLLLAVLLATCVAAPAAEPPPAPINRFAATIAPAERFEIGSMLVERHGSGARALVLVPDLASGSWAWQEAIRELAREHTVYAVTLAGFDGRPPVAGNAIGGARDALRQLILQRRLDQPVLVGHGLGGTLALAVASDAPALVGGVLSIDGLPVFPGNEDMPIQQREQAAFQLMGRVGSANRAAFAARQQQYMRTVGVLDMARGDALAELSARSDPASVGRYLAELMTLDLRPVLRQVRAPVRIVVPYFEPDDGQVGLSVQQKLDYYGALVTGLPTAQLVPVTPARHFVMFDQPAQLAAILRNFLSSL